MQDGYTPLHCAANDGHAEIASALIEAGADISAANKVRSSILLFYRTYMYFTLPYSTTPIACNQHNTSHALFTSFTNHGIPD